MTRSIASSLLVALSVAGCAAQVDPTSQGGSDEAAASTSSAITDTNQVWPLGYHGGTGGGTAYNLGCGPGEVITGIFGRSGSYVDQVGFDCAHVNTDGTLSGEYAKGAFGGGGGGAFPPAHCPANQMVVGIWGRSHTYVDQLDIVCAPAPFQSYPTYLYGGGGSGGDFFIDNCPHGYAVSSLVLKWGNWLDAVQAECTYFSP
jgi:hypothetical protein